MAENRHYGGLDYFKIAAALLVVAIHTSPLSHYSVEADFLLTRVVARIAVPFFLMVTGYFILPQYLFDKSADPSALLRFIRKSALLYLVATIIYLPINIYAGHFEQVDVFSILRMIAFDGTFYHLWYLPASIIGIMLVYLLSRKLPFKGIMWIALLLYCLGLLGDSYFGVIAKVPILSSLYDTGFHLFSYTRNGLFYTPVFLAMGAWLSHSSHLCTKKTSIAGFFASVLIMSAEGLVLRHFEFQRHDSMYFALLPCMFFLFQLMLSWDKKPVKSLRTISLWVYLIHPLFIIVVRGAAKVTGLVDVLVENSLIHYFAVCALSVIFSVIVAKLPIFKGSKSFQRGRAWIELDRKNLRHNVDVLRSLLPDDCELMPAVKANAYGHGAVLVSRELNTMGIKAFCVASVPEGVELRRNGIKGEILVLGYTHPEHFPLLRRYRLMQTVIDYPYAKSLNAYGKNIRVHIKIDTGMHRLGERCEKLDAVTRIFRCKNLKIEGIFTHLCADDTTYPEDKAFTLSQGQAFYSVVSQLKKRGFTCPKIHILSSYGLLNYPGLGGDYARVGIALYGMLSSRVDTENCGVHLKPVLSVKARVALVKDLFQGEAAGYGLQFVAEQDTKIAVLTIGYGDGIPRSLSCGVGKILINGLEAPIIGRICMDQMLVDLTNMSDVKAGDVAVVIGKSGNAEITACDLAEQTGTITNEILSRLGERLERQMI